MRRWRPSWLALAVAAPLLCVLALPAMAQRTGPEPWQFPDRESLEAAQRRHPGYWYENYEAGRDQAGSNRPRDLEEAVDKLRICIAERPTSNLNELHPRNRYSIEYLPYYYLALAYSKLQREDDALACLQREDRFGLAQRSGVAQEFSTLRQRLQTIAEQRERRGTYGELLNQAAAVRGWLGGEGGVSLTADGRQRVERVGTAAERLRQLSSGAVTDPQQENEAYNQLVDELLGLCRGELASRRAALEAHRTADWRDAFASRAAAIDPAACSMPGEGRDAATIARARQAVERCNAQLLQATRQAGAWACDQLRAARRRVTDGIAELQRLSPGTAAAAPPALPRACETDWNAADLAAASQALERIDFGSARPDLVTRAEAVEGDLNRTRGELRRTADAAIGRIPDLSQQCVTELGLAQNKRDLDRLRDESGRALAPGGSPAQLAGLDGRVGEALEALSRGVRQGVERVLAERDGCEGLETANLDALDAAYRTYQGAGPGAELGALCQAVARANRDIRTCWVNNTDAILAKINDYRWLLQAARSNDDIYGAAGGEECVRSGLAALRAERPSRNLDAWVRESQEGMTAAEACLGARGQARRERFGEIGERLSRIERSLGGPAPEGQAEGNATARAVAERARGARSAAAALRAALDSILSLTADPSSAREPGRLRQALGDNGLAAGIPAEWWQALERLAATPDRGAQAWLLVADRAAAGALRDAGGALDSWERLAAVIGPYRALDRSYAAYGNGDLDGAILALRGAQSGGGLPAEGRGAALAHAALAYFLFLKSEVEPDAGEQDGLAATLRRNALQEAEQAARAEAGFRPPPSLFESPAFRRFYDACCTAGSGDASGADR